MWKTLLGLFGSGGEGEAAKPRARKPRAGKAKHASEKKVKAAARATLKAVAGPARSGKGSAKRRGTRKVKFVWPKTPTKAARRASPPKDASGGGDDPNDPNWSQPTQPLL